MRTTKVMRFNDFSDAPALIARTAPVPEPGGGELRPYADGIAVVSDYPRPRWGKENRAIPGHEFSGVVEAVAADVDPHQIGREVFGLNDWFADGATADYCLSALTSGSGKAFPIESSGSGNRSHRSLDGLARFERSPSFIMFSVHQIPLRSVLRQSSPPRKPNCATIPLRRSGNSCTNCVKIAAATLAT